MEQYITYSSVELKSNHAYKLDASEEHQQLNESNSEAINVIPENTVPAITEESVTNTNRRFSIHRLLRHWINIDFAFWQLLRWKTNRRRRKNLKNRWRMLHNNLKTTMEKTWSAWCQKPSYRSARKGNWSKCKSQERIKTKKSKRPSRTWPNGTCTATNGNTKSYGKFLYRKMCLTQRCSMRSKADWQSSIWQRQRYLFTISYSI